jgi:UDP-2,3-diacylglucosamine pyrophosphatase LpxH
MLPVWPHVFKGVAQGSAQGLRSIAEGVEQGDHRGARAGRIPSGQGAPPGFEGRGLLVGAGPLCYKAQPRMSHDLLILSDVHLTDGRAPVAGAEHLVPELEKFLTVHELNHRAGGHWRLVVNGDLFDFLHVQLQPGESVPFPLSRGERARGPGTSAEKSLWKLSRILGANQRTVQALGRFLRAGNEVVLLPGNHDLELYWPEVREAIREALRPHAGDEGVARLSFKPWFYYEPGLIYVEHGSQFDADNRVFRWLAPEVPGRPGVLELSAGHGINRHFTHRLGLGPFVGDTTQSAMGYARWMFRSFGFWRFLKIMWWYFEFAAKMLRWAGKRSPEVQRAEALHRERREALEDEERMPRGSLAAIEAAAPRSVLDSKWRALDRTMLLRVLTSILTTAVAVIVLLAGSFGSTSLAVALAILVPPQVVFALTRHRFTGVADRCYPAAAQAIRAALKVRYVAFGHQHIARAEVPEEGERRYFNLGCWIEGQGFEKVPLHYLEIRRGPMPVAKLKTWPRAGDPAKGLEPARLATEERIPVEGMAEAAAGR